jgi:hypothetical protein
MAVRHRNVGGKPSVQVVIPLNRIVAAGELICNPRLVGPQKSAGLSG